jgi:hypothetical protein
MSSSPARPPAAEPLLPPLLRKGIASALAMTREELGAAPAAATRVAARPPRSRRGCAPPRGIGAPQRRCCAAAAR